MNASQKPLIKSIGLRDIDYYDLARKTMEKLYSSGAKRVSSTMIAAMWNLYDIDDARAILSLFMMPRGFEAVKKIKKDIYEYIIDSFVYEEYLEVLPFTRSDITSAILTTRNSIITKDGRRIKINMKTLKHATLGFALKMNLDMLNTVTVMGLLNIPYKWPVKIALKNLEMEGYLEEQKKGKYLILKYDYQDDEE